MHSPSVSGPCILLVDDDPQILLGTSIILKRNGISNIVTIDDSRELIPFLSKNHVSVVVLDLSMPYKSGKELLPDIKEVFPNIQVIVMTAVEELDTAISCMKNGALDYLVKPVEEPRLVSALKKAVDIFNLKIEVTSLKEQLLKDRITDEEAFADIITQSKKMKSIFKYIEAIALTNQPVLISGETGAGKELIANAIHKVSCRNGKFVAVNIAGVDDAFFSDTLFGHKKGAFSGADSSRIGLIEQAAGGTIFLDEIGDLSEPSQTKLLRLLQESEYYEIGSDIPKRSDARIVVATNCDLKQFMAEKKFRKDLYFRLRTHQIDLPPLRDRVEDIPLLTAQFLKDAANEMGKKMPSPTVELFDLLAAYHYPGNIRELKAMVFDAVARHKSGLLSMQSFRSYICSTGRNMPETVPAGAKDRDLHIEMTRGFPTLKEVQEHVINEALKRSGGNQGVAASLLGITRQALNKRLNKSNQAE
ncbi:MAG: sigma-54-dependent Fis family transcriptional regulator [Nitrospirae bacterium]|nr:sigma-54-dependent Fis family transcriptional regulator [Nitrospirota bacterium]